MAKGFTELFVEGSDDAVRGFVAGFTIGAGIEGLVFVNKDHDIADDPLARHVAELVHLVENVTHVLVADQHRRALSRAIERGGAGIGLKLRGERRVAAARLATSWEVYTREDAARIRRLYEEDLPPGVKLEGYEPSEEIHDEKSHGKGMYAPSHAYVARADCGARGAPDALIPWCRLLREEPFIQRQKIALIYKEEPQKAS